MLKNESSHKATKPAPLRLSHLPDSSGIFTLSNELRMRNILCSVRKGKQAKKKGDECIVCTVRTVPRGMLTIQAVQSYS
jgi:hypothetical protein